MPRHGRTRTAGVERHRQRVVRGHNPPTERGVLDAGARSLGKFLPMLITAAGTAKPARVLVLGAGVAGLQAIATATRLGAFRESGGRIDDGQPVRHL